MSTVTINKLASIKSRSSKAISIFQKTVSDLVKVNSEIDTADAVRVSKIDTLQGERNELAAVKSQNVKFINKLNEFLGIE
jgi:hypothetical protein